MALRGRALPASSRYAMVLERCVRPRNVCRIPSPGALYLNIRSCATAKTVHLDTQNSYSCKTFPELLRGYFVFNLCSHDVLLNNQVKILSWLKRLAGERFLTFLMRHTVFGQFMSGVEEAEVLRTKARLAGNNVRSMFAYTAAEVHGAVKESISDEALKQLLQENFEHIKRSLDIAAASKDSYNRFPKVTAKLTFIAPAEFFRRLSSIITSNNKLLAGADRNDPTIQEAVTAAIHKCHAASDAPRLGLPGVEGDQTAPSLATNHILFHLMFNELVKDVTASAADATVTTEELADAVKKIDQLAQAAVERHVILGWDAEQTYLQPAMDLLVLESMRKFNRSRPAVQNTYQAYLKDTFQKVKRDVTAAETEGFCWSGKIVRGAYIIEERALAESQGYEDPVNPTYEATTAMYEDIMDFILTKIVADPDKFQVIFATHNENTCQRVLESLQKHNIDMNSQSVSLAQLLGMRDNLTFALGQAGVPVEKLLHYGPVLQAVAWLSRRLNENRGGIQAADVERRLMGREIRRRMIGLLGGTGSVKPAVTHH